ncbi:AbrB/MazE/SpoVT family DNA-binding domain-containing protein [Fervidibacter sacchari]|uniref:Bifunctional DNA-binding transcriptional regulator/antitoxin component of YhaV-PrlF toxin-antitoxin module n=1 Tax=Candidatus Fervidibacter sacchari TaxID=1448929 RepID=A0ABT2EL21_9BACT|nr:AbrB/MazE/SpoVT family DNA-binding domain-containing protein [Candidatus Fervidibacter sacchari]MCS3918634.1 bifunctional DNA-binding transcriptional regulator/antitoxin component of YhaV-PrlF toxin-antitoxin module [Candidatus Fervidibacter sacchari]WKU17611.1 AbrB/MazE/SpoVT family DNA-binding domain-containing protein [Candidatus Fervidibacter sacchari]
MAQAPMKIKLPKRLIKALGLKPGDRLELVVDDEGNGLVVQQHKSIAEETFGIWSDMEEDGVTYVRRLRKEWEKRANW